MPTATKKPSIPWKRAKTVTIPIPKTGTKFRQYPRHALATVRSHRLIQLRPRAGRTGLALAV